MTYPLNTAAKILTISATLSMYLMSTSANAALNFGNASTDASPTYSGQQVAAFVKSDRDRGTGHSKEGRNDDNGRNEGHGNNDGGNDGEGHGNNDGGNGGEGHGGGDGGNDGGNDGNGEGND